MATVDELKSVVREALASRGVLGEVRARLRAEVFRSLDNEDNDRLPLSNENTFINELVREYLEFNRYNYAASVLRAESGMPSEPLHRDFMARELNISEDSHTASVPLLYGLVGHFLNNAKRVREADHLDHLDQPGLDNRPTTTPTHTETNEEETEVKPFIVHGGSSR